jgi:hypothetical protein
MPCDFADQTLWYGEATTSKRPLDKTEPAAGQDLLVPAVGYAVWSLNGPVAG